MEKSNPPRGLPGGIALPGALFVSSFALFVVAFMNPGLIDLGTHVSAAAMGVLASVITFFWLLIAIAKRPPPDPR